MTCLSKTLLNFSPITLWFILNTFKNYKDIKCFVHQRSSKKKLSINIILVIIMY